jgi:hypothetical protein
LYLEEGEKEMIENGALLLLWRDKKKKKKRKKTYFEGKINDNVPGASQFSNSLVEVFWQIAGEKKVNN